MKNAIRVVLLLLGAMALTAAPVAADDRDGRRATLPSGDATLYEVTEIVHFDAADGVRVSLRDAVATLLGKANVGTPLCPTDALVAVPGAQTCTITGMGQDSVSLMTGQGPVWGTFDVVINAPGNSAVHVPDLPLLTGTFKGDVDLSPAVFYKIPIGYLRNGQVTIDQTGQTIAFSGTFRLPFAVSQDGSTREAKDSEDAFYLSDNGQLVRVRYNERDLGFPLTRLEVTFAR